MTPQVSVVLPVRDGMPLLERAVRGVLDQPGVDFELVVVDDGSVDGSGDYLRALGDERVRVVAGPGRGIVSALNLGIDTARAPLIARMDADDESLPGRLAAQVAAFAADPGLVVAGTAHSVVDDDGAVIRIAALLLRDRELKRQLQWRGPFCHGSIMMRTDAVRAVGGYREEWQLVEDFELYRRLAAHGAFANVDRVLYAYRQSPGPPSSPEKARRQRELHERLVSTPYDAAEPTLSELREGLRWYERRQGALRPELVAAYRRDQQDALASAVARRSPAGLVARRALAAAVAGPRGLRPQVRQLRAVRAAVASRRSVPPGGR